MYTYYFGIAKLIKQIFQMTLLRFSGTSLCIYVSISLTVILSHPIQMHCFYLVFFSVVSLFDLCTVFLYLETLGEGFAT